ncbi:Vacuolar H+-ATPase V1 sector subunit E [Klebsormidium nitens]|uniref:Vacuolar H+-ATPase V1 sector subunit E n=1 Tax=Klebsormidium nitens TaxID=105231 RepID=A0A0U9HIX0_KLENI|nr:Vacuolar H+-ATPase V1 sector subunit E [Klebsormidium nitens]|eukprot:GAQ80593.1 Vacuolar H+-ATPase V1 sector subunit E [Klebsormidium nitens]
MNDADVSKQIQQMVQFIKQEAEEKANEIAVATEEEFNIEKLQLVEAEKAKIRKEYERKEKQVETKKKIEYSTQLNAARLRLLQAQDDIVKSVKEQADKQLATVGTGDSYKNLLQGLILQGLLRLEEESVQLRCREADLKVVQSVLDPAKKAYAEKTGKKATSINVDSSTFLPPAPKSGSHDPACSGGIVIASKDGKIVCNNTLDARLEISFNQNLPAIRKAMFGGHERA